MENNMAGALLAGAVLGLSVAAPFGPVSLICVQRSLNSGYRHGMMAGFGAATAHGVFATAAIASAGAASAILAPCSSAIRLISALILVALGVRTVLRVRAAAAPPSRVSLRATYASLVLLALSNPMTIIPYIAFAAAMDADAGAPAFTFWSVPSITLAAATWYTGLVVVTSVCRRAIPVRTGRLLNVLAGAALIIFGTIIGHDLLR